MVGTPARRRPCGQRVVRVPSPRPRESPDHGPGHQATDESPLPRVLRQSRPVTRQRQRQRQRPALKDSPRFALTLGPLPPKLWFWRERGGRRAVDLRGASGVAEAAEVAGEDVPPQGPSSRSSVESRDRRTISGSACRCSRTQVRSVRRKTLEHDLVTLDHDQNDEITFDNRADHFTAARPPVKLG